MKLTYKIADEYISNEGSEYAENCLDLQGIKRYNIFRYFISIISTGEALPNMFTNQYHNTILEDENMHTTVLRYAAD